MRAIDRKYAVLALLLVLSGAYWIGGAIGVVGDLRLGQTRARLPFDFGYRMQTISGITPEAEHAGAKIGDTLLEFGGRSFTGLDIMRAAVLAAKPGDSIPAVIRRASDGLTVPIEVRLAPRRTKPAPLGEWLIGIGLQIAFPLFCLCLGFWVAMARPEDSNAWLLLALLISLETLTPLGDWTEPWEEARVFWAGLSGLSWPVWMMLFGIYFPERSRLDLRFPWIKWLIALILGVSGAAILALWVGKQVSFDSIAWLRPILAPLDTVQKIVSMTAISIFFVSLGEKSGTASSRDASRRIGLVWIGASIGLTPTFIVALIALFRNADFGIGVPDWLLYIAFGCLPIFPLTLAYVILVQRAMEVRMVIRQSAKYTLARGLLWAFGALIVGIAINIIVNVGRNVFHPLTEVALSVVAVLLLIVRKRFTGRLFLWMDKRFFREAYSAEQVLSDLSNEARRFVESGPLLQTVTRRIAETLHVDRISVLLRESDGYRLESFVDGASAPSSLLLPEATSVQLLRSAQRPATVYFDKPDPWLREASELERQTLKELDAQVLLALPGRNDLLGVMALGPKRSEEPYSKTDLQLLQSIASQTGLALENSRLISSLAEEAARRERFNREIEIAREVQERLFPQACPSIAGLDCAGHCRPAQGVGGDYYDFIALPEGRLGIAIGDISGKGISAALLMSSLRASLRGQTLSGPEDLAILMRNVNSLLYEASTANRYATFFYSQYDPATRRLDFVNAGHNPPLILRGRKVLKLEAGGPVVGLLQRVSYEQQSLTLAPGDIFFAYTDGISEAMTRDDEEWGEDRMSATALANSTLPASEIIERVIEAADTFTSGAPQHDDMTLIVVKVLAA